MAARRTRSATLAGQRRDTPTYRQTHNHGPQEGRVGRGLEAHRDRGRARRCRAHQNAGHLQADGLRRQSRRPRELAKAAPRAGRRAPRRDASGARRRDLILTGGRCIFRGRRWNSSCHMTRVARARISAESLHGGGQLGGGVARDRQPEARIAQGSPVGLLRSGITRLGVRSGGVCAPCVSQRRIAVAAASFVMKSGRGDRVVTVCCSWRRQSPRRRRIYVQLALFDTSRMQRRARPSDDEAPFIPRRAHPPMLADRRRGPLLWQPHGRRGLGREARDRAGVFFAVLRWPRAATTFGRTLVGLTAVARSPLWCALALGALRTAAARADSAARRDGIGVYAGGPTVASSSVPRVAGAQKYTHAAQPAPCREMRGPSFARANLSE